MKRRTNNADGNPVRGKLFANDFFIPFDGGLFDDIKDGKLTPVEYCVYSMLLRQVDFETGVWTGSASYICIGWGGQLNQRTVQRCLKQLEERGLINRFHRRGQRHDYAVAIHDYRVRFGKWARCKLDANATTDPRHPVYLRDCETTTISERNDRESTAQPQRKHSESTATPIARNTPEYPDLPEGDRPPETSTTDQPRLIACQLDDLCADLYEAGRQEFSGKNRMALCEILDQYPASEIKSAWQEFIAEKDEIEMKFTVKKFCEGGGISILIARRKRETRKLEQEALIKKLTEREQGKAAAEREEEDKRQHEEDEWLSEGLL